MNLNRRTILSLALAAFLTMVFVVQAGAVDMTAQVGITQPTLTVSVKNPLDFGAIIPALTPSVVTINASAGPVAAPTVMGSALVVGGSSGAIDVMTNVDANVSINCSGVLGAQAGDTSMLSIFGATTRDPTATYASSAIALLPATVNTNSTPTGLLATAGPTGTNTVNIGGVLNVSNALRTGTYTGTMTIDIAYQ